MPSPGLIHAPLHVLWVREMYRGWSAAASGDDRAALERLAVPPRVWPGSRWIILPAGVRPGEASS
jgi:hypothetical protein